MSTETLSGGPDAPLVEYERSLDEPMSEAVLVALERAGVDLYGTETVLHDRIDPDAVDALFRCSNVSGVQLTFRIWNYAVSLHPEAVRVYRGVSSSDTTPDTQP